MKENYIPKAEELKQAEELMTSEQKEASQNREKYHWQKLDPFDDFIENMDQDDERRNPTEEEKAQMDANLISLGKVFKNSDINWHLDGALNISLANPKGEYMGVHKDVDISIEENELEKTEAQLAKNGYGLFVSHTGEDGKNILERVGANNISDDGKYLMIAAIDKDGKIRGDEKLTFIDTHIIKRDKAGNPIGWVGVKLPKKWFEPQTIDFQGQKINLSHPAKVAYFKLHSNRKYDQKDLLKFIANGSLSLDDINEVEQIFKNETEARKEQVTTLFSRVTKKIKDNMSGEQIFNILIEEPMLAQAANKNQAQVKELAGKIATIDKSEEKIVKLALKTIKLESLTKEIENKIEELKKFEKNK